jgi:polar amino acid transport system permease protein
MNTAASATQLSRWAFYGLVALALGGFIYYLLQYQQRLPIYVPFLLGATLSTLMISVVSIILAILLGGLGAWGKLSGFRWARWLVSIYVEFIRGTPTLVQLLFWAYGIGWVFSNLGIDPRQIAFNVMTILQNNRLVSPLFNFMFYGILGLGFNYGAYLTEVFRAGVQSVPKGQTEAALSLGMNGVQATRRIILPQAIRMVIPPFTNYFITLIQDSSLLYVLGVNELQQSTTSLAYPLTDPNAKLFVFILGALFYLALCYPLSLVTKLLERRLNPGS